MSSASTGIPKQLLEEFNKGRYSRRQILKRTAFLGLSLPALSALLAACAEDDATDDEDDATDDEDDATDDSDAGTGDDEEAPSDDSTDDDEQEEAEESPEEDDSSEDESDDSESEQDGEVEASGNLIMSLATEPLTLENWNAFSRWGHPIIRNVMEALTNRDPETNELVPELATSWEQVDDSTWRFEIREGVTFHNGEELNAEIVAYGLNYTWDPENGFEILAILGPELTAEAVDEYTVDITTVEPDPLLPTRLYFSPIPSMQQLEEDPDSAQDSPVGTGPYTFVEWQRGQFVRMTANPDWWGHGASDAGGSVSIQDVEVQFREESTVRASQLSAGEAHVTSYLTPEDMEQVPVAEQVPSIETIILRLDCMHVAMSDIRVREAIALAVDMQTVATDIFEASQAASHIYSPAASGYNDDLEPYPHDEERAAELIQEAQADGVPIDAPITVVTTGSTPRTPELVQYVASQLQSIGLTAESQVIEDGQYRPEVFGTSYQDVSEDRGWITNIGHGNELMDASASIARYYSCDPGSDSTFCDEEVDEMTAEASLLTDQERDEAFQEIAARVHEEYATLPVIHEEIIYGLSEDLNWEPRLDGFMLLKEMSFS